MRIMTTIKEKFNDTKEWIVDHKTLIVTDALIVLGCAGAIGVAVAVNNEKERRLDQQVEDFMNFPREHPREWIENEDILDLYKAGLVTDDELYPEVVDEIHKMMNEE